MQNPYSQNSSSMPLRLNWVIIIKLLLFSLHLLASRCPFPTSLSVPSPSPCSSDTRSELLGLMRFRCRLLFMVWPTLFWWLSYWKGTSVFSFRGKDLGKNALTVLFDLPVVTKKCTVFFVIRRVVVRKIFVPPFFIKFNNFQTFFIINHPQHFISLIATMNFKV